ncbi:MAG TPA: glycosyltransferase family 4 protein [Sedimentisphaerales bacterium]|nr:glycosyltransferase family 4 protein [Sedimentisphaerales bacterium]
MNECIETTGKLSICFVSLDNFAALVDDPKFGHIGGAEIQQVIIGGEFAKRGYRVSFITLDYGQDDELEIDGMRIIKAYGKNVGIRVLRFLHPRLTSLWRAMRRVDADIYYQRTSDSITGIVAAFCRWHRRKFVFAVASDASCLVSLPYCTARHERVFCRYGLRRANLVIAQTVTQKRLLRESFGIDSTVIPNCAPDYGGSLGGADTMASARGRRLLWIGSLKPVKRLELLLDIAEQLQYLQFDVIGDGNSESEYVQRLRSRAKGIPNLHLHGMVSHSRVHQFYQRTAALICTSRAEGFPNIFLEAWSHGLPVVTTFDPDGIISSQGLGKVGKDVPELTAGIRELLESPAKWLETSQSAREYFRENHSVDKVMERFERVFCDVVNVACDNGDGDSV